MNKPKVRSEGGGIPTGVIETLIQECRETAEQWKWGGVDRRTKASHAWCDRAAALLNRSADDLAALLVGPIETKNDDDGLTRTGELAVDSPPQHASTDKANA